MPVPWTVVPSVQAGDSAEPAPAPAVLGSAGLHPAVLSRTRLQSGAGIEGRGWEGGFAHQQVPPLPPQELTESPGSQGAGPTTCSTHSWLAPGEMAPCSLHSDARTEQSFAHPGLVRLGVILLNTMTKAQRLRWLSRALSLRPACLNHSAGQVSPRSQAVCSAARPRRGDAVRRARLSRAQSGCDTARKKKGKGGLHYKTPPPSRVGTRGARALLLPPLRAA